MNHIIDKKTSRHYLWGDQCDAWVLMENHTLSVKLESMPKGTKEKLHFHQKAQQFFYILKGTATFYVNDERKIVHLQQGISIEPEIKHLIANESSEDLEFMVVSQPSTDHDRHE